MTTTTSLTKTFSRHPATLVAPETAKLLALGEQRGWNFFVLGQAPLPTEPVRLDNWLVTPVELDSSSVPARTLERVHHIYASGLRPKGFVLVHEAPKLLAAPLTSTSRSTSKDLSTLLSNPTVQKVGIVVALAVGAAVLVGLVLLALALVVAVASMALMAMLVFGAVALDPILVAVTEDGYWVEVDRWLTQ